MQQSEFSLDEASNILGDLEKAVRAAQGAALARRLPELQQASAQQTELCGQLNACLNPRLGKTAGLNSVSQAGARRLQIEVRVLSAVLQRMRRDFFIMRNAMAGVSVSYRRGRDESRAGI